MAQPTQRQAPEIFFGNLSCGQYANDGHSISALTFANSYSLTGTTVSALRCLDLANPNAKNIAEFLATFITDHFTVR